MSSAAKTPTFLTHVNGLRALAILGILIYHLNAGYCSAGYFGVDVFLVISGYFLLASLMKAERARDIHYGSFLLKKSWRILPPWLVVTCVFCFGSVWFMIPTDRIEICSTASRSAFFAADFYIDHLYDYFNQKAHQNLFLHYWYLSITCQMYILVPVLLMLLLRFGSRKMAGVVLALIGVLSLFLYVLTATPQVPEPVRHGLLAATGMKTAYYHLLPRLWEILAGGLVLLLPAWPEKRRLRALLESLAVLGMVASFFCFETGSPQVYVAVVAAILFIRYGGGGWVSRVLAWRPIQWVGTISFSLYLWHWPIMAAWKYVRLGEITWADELGMILLSLSLAAVAWYAVERLKMPKSPGKLMLGLRLLPVALMVAFAIGIGPYYRSLRREVGDMLKGEGLITEMNRKALAHSTDAAIQQGFPAGEFENLPVYIGADASAAPSFILMGDSHALHTFPGLDQYCNEHGGRGIFFNNSIVPYWWCYKEYMGRWTQARAEGLIEYLRQHPSIRYVFIAQLWENRLYARTVNDNDGFPTMDWREMKSLDIDEQIALREQGLRETCRRLTEMGLRVVLLTDVPFLPHKLSPREQWIKQEMLSREAPSEFITPVATHKTKAGRYLSYLEQMVSEGVAWAVIDCAEPLRCGDHYRTRNDAGLFLYSDNNHITYAGSEIVGRYVMTEWEGLKREDAAQAPAAETPAP